MLLNNHKPGKKSFFEKQGGARASVGVGLGAMVAGNAKPKKRVRFCAFDLSSVDMPSDAIQDSDVPGTFCAFQTFHIMKVLDVVMRVRAYCGLPGAKLCTTSY